MSSQRTLGFVLIAAVGLLAARSAAAHPTDNGLYLEGGGGIEYYSLPTSEAIIRGGLLDEVGRTDGSFWAETAFFAIGFVDGDGTRFPDPIGRDARIEARVRWIDGDSEQSVATPLALGFFPINNPIFPNGSGGSANRARFETDLESWDVDLLYRTEVPIDDVFALTPFIGLTYTHFELDNSFKIDEDGVSLDGVFDLKDETDAHYAGLVLGSDLDVHPFEWLTLRGSLRADLMGVTAKMDADQSFGPRQPAESDRDADFAARVGAGLGFSLHLGAVELGVDALARYHSYVPIVEHPTFFFDRTSHIEGRAAWSGSILGRLTIQFP